MKEGVDRVERVERVEEQTCGNCHHCKPADDHPGYGRCYYGGIIRMVDLDSLYLVGCWKAMEEEAKDAKSE